MNKIFKVKRNSAGQSVVTSEIAKSHGRVLALAVAAAITSHSAVATTVYSTTSPEVKFDNKNTILIGANLQVETETGYNSSNISIGNNSKIYDLSDSLSIGNNNILGNQSTLNSGNQPVRAIAIGSDNTVGGHSIGIGAGTISNAVFSIAIGDKGTSADAATTATGFGSIAIGADAKALIAPDPISDATRNIAIGSSSFTNAKEAIAFGYNANATHANSVALGSNSVTEAPVSTNSVTNNGIKYTFDGSKSGAVVSIGHETGSNTVKRQIVNLAAGRVSDNSTDAVNGSQLFAAVSTLGNVATTAKNILGGNAALAANGTISMTNIGGTGQNTIHDAIAFVNAKQGGAAVNVVQGDGVTVTNATVNGEKTFTVGLSDATKANITKAQTDAAKGIADAKAADAKAVAAQNTANAANTTAQAANTTANRVAATTYTFSVANGQTAATTTTGTADTWRTTAADSLTLGATTDLSVSTDGAGKVIYGLSDATKANITKAQTDAAKGIADAKAADAKAVAAQNTANTAVTKADAAQATADKAAKDIKALDDIVVKYDSAAKDTVTLGGADGTTITNVKDGAITADSKDAVNGGQLYAVKGVADTAKATANANKVAISALDDKKAEKSALAATDAKVKANADAIAKGFNVKTSDATSTNYQLGDTVSILGGKNIDTTTTADGITVSLKDDIAVKTIAIDGSTVGLSATGINAGDLKVTGVADGAITADSKDAVNGGQLYAVKGVADTAKATANANKVAISALDDKKAEKSALAATDAKVKALDDIVVKYDSAAKDTVTLGGADGT
ncbi:ESPR-type extended signal peptide-containing protein, partial [Moraxella caviae]